MQRKELEKCLIEYFERLNSWVIDCVVRGVVDGVVNSMVD